MKFILMLALTLSVVGCSTAGYRAPASSTEESHIDKIDRHLMKYERLGN